MRSTDMKIALVLTDSSTECRKSLEMLKSFADSFSADIEVFIVLEDLYRLESASVSLGVPLPPDTIKNAKERAKNRVKTLWRHVVNDESAQIEIKTIAGELAQEALKFVDEEKPDLLLWGCQPTATLCRVIDEVKVPSLIIK